MTLIITGIKIDNKRPGLLRKPDLFVYPKVNDRLRTKRKLTAYILFIFPENARETGTASKNA
ncbi:MAG: hypothetical protein K2G12_02795 [Prevotella sp.]|nr:hypothetical protein [Prevotella sp.]